MLARRYAPFLAAFAQLVMGTITMEATAQSEPNAAPPPEPEGIGLEAGVSFMSAYVWRGLNLFADADESGQLDQNDQNMLLAPSLSYEVPGTALTVGYWGAYQLNGDNKSELVDAGVGAEQDVLAFWTFKPAQIAEVDIGATYFFYPFAKEEVAGTSFPSMIEPSIIASLDAPLFTLGMTLAYFHAIPSELKAARHLYLNPNLSKGFEISPTTTVELAAGFGYKIWASQDHEEDKSNTYDVLAGVSMPIEVAPPLSVTPVLNWAWTNLEERSFGEEHVLFGGLTAAVAL